MATRQIYQDSSDEEVQLRFADLVDCHSTDFTFNPNGEDIESTRYHEPDNDVNVNGQLSTRLRPIQKLRLSDPITIQARVRRENEPPRYDTVSGRPTGFSL